MGQIWECSMTENPDKLTDEHGVREQFQLADGD